MGFPSHLIDPYLKDKKWHLDYVKAAYECYMNDTPKNMFYHAADRYNKTRQYALAKQATGKYKTALKVEDDGLNESWMNLDYTPLGILAKFRRNITGKLNKVEYNIEAAVIDALARSEMDAVQAKAKAKLLMRDQALKVNPALLDSPALVKQFGDPTDLEELEIMSKWNGRHAMAREAELAIAHVFQQNKVEELRKLIRKDLVDWNVAGYKEYLENGSIRIRKVDPRNILISMCEQPDFKDALYIGELLQMSLGELRQSAGNAFNSQEYEEIARQIGSKWGNRSSGGSKQINDMKVRIVDLEFFSVDDLFYEERLNRFGNPVVGRTTYGAQDSEGSSIYKVSATTVYKCKWIIGTNFIWDWGLQTDMKRAKQSLTDTELSYHLVCGDLHDMDTTSIMEQCIPIADRMQIAWLKLQNAINMARPKGIVIEIGALEDVPLGAKGKKFSPLELIDLYEKKGILVYRKLDAQGRQSNYKPIEELENGLGRDAIVFYDIIQRDIQLLRDISGMNELTDGSTPDSRTLTTVAQLAYEGTNNALATIVESERMLLEDLAKSIILRIQDLAEDGMLEGYVTGLGSNTVEFFKASPKLALHEFGIILRDRPTDEQRQQLLQQMQMFEGQGILMPEDIFLIKNATNVKQAEEILSYKVKKRMDEKRQAEVQNQQMVIQGQQQSAVVTEQQKQKSLVVEYRAKMEYELAVKKADYEIQEMKMKYQLKMKEMELHQKSQDTQVTVGAKKQTEQIKAGSESKPAAPLFDPAIFDGGSADEQTEEQPQPE